LKRRSFITLLGGAAMWPLAAATQQQPVPAIGLLIQGSPEPSAKFVAAFREGLGEIGYVESQSVMIEYRWAEGKNDRLPALAGD
jgi:putative ABC transport system substrate-binding protein